MNDSIVSYVLCPLNIIFFKESKHLKQFKSIYKFQRKCMRFIKLWTMNMYIHLIEGRRIKYSKIHQTLENGSCVLARLVVEAGGWRRLPPPPPLSPPSSFSSTPFIRSSRCFLFNILTILTNIPVYHCDVIPANEGRVADLIIGGDLMVGG